MSHILSVMFYLHIIFNFVVATVSITLCKSCFVVIAMFKRCSSV